MRRCYGGGVQASSPAIQRSATGVALRALSACVAAGVV
jgi:hypothetical protein